MGFKDLKREYIVESAKKLFFANSISNVTIKDISAVSGIGEATIYRYFTNKENLAIAVSLSIQKELLPLVKNIDESKKGIEGLEAFFNLFKSIFVSNPAYFSFISEFDTLYLKDLKNDYSISLDNFYDLFISSYKKGLKDGSVKKIDDINLFYYTATHSLLELCKKMAFSESHLKQDRQVKKIDEIEYLISILISVLKA